MALTRPRYSNIADSDFKNSCRTVTTTSITLSGGAPSSYDSLTLAAGDRLLVTAQGSSAQNGIYVVTTLGTGSNGTWTRSPDANDSSKLNAGMQVTIGEGTYAGQLFKLTTPDPINLGTTGLTFISLAGAAAGSTGQLQYNLSGSMSGAANITVNSNGNLKVTSNVELSGNLWQGNRAGHGIAYTTKSSTPPANAMVGDYWYDTSTDIRYIFHSDGVSSFWLDETTAPRSGYTFSNTPPIDPIVGDQWYDTSTDIIYERITDGTSTYWVDLTTRLGAVSGATVNSNLVAAATTTSTSTTTGALVVKGGAGIAGNMYVGGNIAIDGGQMTLYDSIVDLHTYGNLATWGIDDGKDIGMRMHYYNAADKLAFVGLENSTKTLQFLIDATEVASNVTGTYGNVRFGSLFLSNTTSSADNTSGALVVGGGVGITGNINLVYNPVTAIGSAIQLTGKDTQGGTGWFDFLKVTNTTSGATNPNKSIRLNSTGGLEVINSAYSATLLTLTDAGALSVASTMSSTGFYVNNKQAVNGPAFRAYIAGAQTITSGSQQKVVFGSETFDTNSNFASSTFTPTVEGYYQLNATVRIAGSSGTGECMITIWKNGSEYARGNNESGTEQGASWYSMQVSDLAYANGSTDYFEIYIQQTSGGSRDTTAGQNISYFSGVMVRGA